MSRFLGIDEAGYGPNLGPLVIGCTQWTAPKGITASELWSLLDPLIARERRTDPKQLRLGDSKSIYQAGKGFAELERTVLAFWGLTGELPRTLESWLDGWGFPRHGLEEDEPWYFEPALPLPAVVPPDLIQADISRLRDHLELKGIKVRLAGIEWITPTRFNQLLDSHLNKANILTSLSVELARDKTTLRECPLKSTHVLFDRHGGRKTYAGILTDRLGVWTRVVEESAALSRYENDYGSFQFQVQGEQLAPVALASMLAKYVRELSMLAFNRYWQLRISGLKPTAGYPLDAWRYLEAIRPLMETEGMKLERQWRAK